jgi:DtxR family Mn-dependent transcriptional regulator
MDSNSDIVENHALDLSMLSTTEKILILAINRWNKDFAPNASDLAKEVNIPASTVTTSLKRMKDTVENSKGKRKKSSMLSLIFDWEPHHSITLTSFGKNVAEHIEKHHHILELFLFEDLKLSKTDAHNESEILGTMISCNITKAMNKKLKKEFTRNTCICPEENHICIIE